MARRLHIGLIALAMAFLAPSVYGQEVMVAKIPHPCVETPVMSKLMEKDGRHRAAYAVREDGSLFVFWKGPNGWSLVQTFPNGVSCTLAGATNWVGLIPGKDA